MNRKIFMYLLLFFFSGICNAVGSCHLLEKDGKRVLILGYPHGSQFEEHNLANIKELNILLCSALPTLDQPIELIYEALSDEEESALAVSIPETIKYLKSLPPKEKLHLEAYDPRGLESVAINSLYQVVGNFAWQTKERKISLDLAKFLMQPIKQPFSLGDYLAMLESDGKKIVVWRDSFPKGSVAYRILQEKFDKYKRAQKEVKQLFEASHKERPLGEVVYDAFFNASRDGNFYNGSKAYTWIQGLHKICILDLDWLVAEAGYFVRCLQAEVPHIQFIGKSHVANVVKDLKACGYRLVREADAFSADGLKFEVTREFAEDFYDVVCMLMTGKQIESRGNNAGELPTCAQCAAQPKELMRCSQCKVAKYCDRDCQRKHWPAHKKTCQQQ